jgi:hypothetical protein
MYRENAAPPEEELHSLLVRTARGRNPVGLTATLSIMALLALILAWGDLGRLAKLVLAAATLGFAALAWLFHTRRARRLAIVRRGEAVHLVIPAANVELEFPLITRTRQHEVRIKGIPMYHVFLQLIDVHQRAIVLHETRGALHGEQPGWGSDMAAPDGCPIFDVSGAGTLAKLRSWVHGR